MLIFSAALVNNLAMTHAVGVDLQLAASKRMYVAQLIGFTTCCCFLLLFPLAYLLQNYIIDPLSLQHLSLLFLALVMLSVVLGLQHIATKLLPMLAGEIQTLTPLLIMNSSLLGAVLYYQSQFSSLLQTFCIALGHGAGFILILLMIHCLRERIDQDKVLASFRDIPILLICLGILSLGLGGLAGIS